MSLRLPDSTLLHLITHILNSFYGKNKQIDPYISHILYIDSLSTTQVLHSSLISIYPIWEHKLPESAMYPSLASDPALVWTAHNVTD